MLGGRKHEAFRQHIVELARLRGNEHLLDAGCGTGLTALATGRVDGLFFVVGGLVGAAAYMVSYASVATTRLLDSAAGGKTTLGTIPGTEYPALFDTLPGDWLGVAVGVAFVLIAALLPRGAAAQKAQPIPAE